MKTAANPSVNARFDNVMITFLMASLNMTPP
jgi:hypothetical protein